MILGFILPGYFHYKVCGKDLTVSERATDVGLIIFGAIMGTLGTIESGGNLIRVVYEGLTTKNG